MLLRALTASVANFFAQLGINRGDLENLLFLQTFNISGNSFYGHVSDVFEHLFALTSFDFSQNNLVRVAGDGQVRLVAVETYCGVSD